MKDIKGFTLMELLTTMIVVAVLAAVAIPRLAGNIEKSKTSEAINTMSALRRATLAYYDEHDGNWPGDYLSTTEAAEVSKIEYTLGINLPTSVHGWFFSVGNPIGTLDGQCYNNNGTPYGVPNCAIFAYKDSLGSSNFLRLDVPTGEWTGSGDYCDPTCAGGAGKYWPNL